MKVIDQIVDFLARLVMGASAIAVFGVTFAQVLCRYVLKSPYPGARISSALPLLI